MKRKFPLSFSSGLPGLLLVLLALFTMGWQMRLSGQQAAQATSGFDGAWRLVKTSEVKGPIPEVVKILVDGSFTFAAYDRQQNRFIGAGGGTFAAGKGSYRETYEYLTGDSAKVGTQIAYTVDVKGNNMQVSFRQKGTKVTQTWQRMDDAGAQAGSLAGAWRIREREGEGGQMTVIRQGPRKTIKWLSDSRFQWAAINTQTREFFGTGGGTYTLQNGKYTEHIEFFSRDPKRVGMSLSFDYELKDGDWHHRGLSSTGNKIYEIWTRKQ
jgi:hypothetical protein